MVVEDAELNPRLRTTAADRGAAILRMLSSALPTGISGIFSELITQIIPNQREERALLYITYLGKRIQNLDLRLEELSDKLGAERLALFEDGMIAAAHATTTERIERIAKITAEGMSADEATADAHREIIRVLNQLSDTDIAHLAKLGRPPMSLAESSREEECSRTQKPQNPSFVEFTRSEGYSLIEKMEDLRAIEARRTHKLTGLGLVESQFASSSQIKTGKQLSYGPTKAGRLLLKKVGLEKWTPPPIAMGSFSGEGDEK